MNFIKILLIILVAILLSSCSKSRDYPLIDGYLTKVVFYGGDTTWDRYIEVFDDDGLPMIPVVKLNGDEVELYDVATAIRLCTYWDSIHFETAKEYELTVDHYYGQAHTKIWMPGEFSMLSPGPTYILNRDSVLLVTWRKSDKATWYWFSIYIDYDYEDTMGEWDNEEFYHDTIVYDTFIRYPRNYFFPDYVRIVLEGEAEAGAWALDGPNRFKPGTKGNVGGQGFGFFSATYQPQELDFYVGAPPKTPKLRNSSKVWDRLREQIKLRQIKY